MKCPSKAKTQSSRTITLLLINVKLSSNDQTVLKPNIVEHVLVWYKLLTDTIGSSFQLYALFSVWGLRMCRHQNEMKVAAEERRGGGTKGELKQTDKHSPVATLIPATPHAAVYHCSSHGTLKTRLLLLQVLLNANE